MKKKLLAGVLCLSLLAFIATGSACRKHTRREDLVARVRLQAAQVLNKDVNEIEIAEPLVDQGADDLAIVEIVMALEDSFNIEVSDSSVGDKIEETCKTLTVEQLAEIVSKSDKRK